MFDWDKNNLRKVRAHRIKPAEVEQGLSNGPILIYELRNGCGANAGRYSDRTRREDPGRHRV
ncbi:hypothetical protein SBA3_620006 [Candidatus Sulfopaludibacter sp. SbA3]|nr:hypothetical protein SBA3_620006 [Candidatus Sulfopaludibacter sp. SbA3]